MRVTAKVKWDGDEANLVWENGKLSGDHRAIDFATTVDWEAYGPFGGLGLDCDGKLVQLCLPHWTVAAIWTDPVSD